MILKNTTTNEYSRNKWNGKRMKNRSRKEINNEAGCFSKLKFYYTSKLDISRADVYFKVKGE